MPNESLHHAQPASKAVAPQVTLRLRQVKLLRPCGQLAYRWDGQVIQQHQKRQDARIARSTKA